MNDLNPSVLAPMGFVAIGALLVLVLEVVFALWSRPGATASPVPTLRQARLSVLLAAVSTVMLGLAVYTAAAMLLGGTLAVFNPANPMLQLDSFSCYAIVMVGVGAILSVWLSVTYLPALHLAHSEFYALLLLSTTGMFVMVTAVDLIALYMGLELMSLPLYALAGLDLRLRRSNEAALKYFLTGGFASAILLYGFALLYGATGHTDFAGIREGFHASDALATAGLGLVVAGFAFKMSLAPFHQWAPDVYEGAPTAVSGFMSVTVKIASFVIFLRFLVLALPLESDGRLDDVLWVISALSMVVGNLMAIIQRNLKRMLAYSGVGHAGLILVGYIAGKPDAIEAVLFYLFAYLFMNLGAFGALMTLTRGGRDYEHIDDLDGLAESRPALAAIMTVFMLSLAGIPGTAGFIAKFEILSAAVSEDLIGLALIGALTSVVAAFYYLRVVVAMYMREGIGESPTNASSSEVVVLLLCAATLLYFGIFPDVLPLDAVVLTFGEAR